MHDINMTMAIEQIVVVDDEMMIHKALETQLRNKCFSVASTGDLKRVRKILARVSFDLVFLMCACPIGMALNFWRKSLRRLTAQWSS